MRRYPGLHSLRELFLSVTGLGRRLEWWAPLTPLRLRITIYRIWNFTKHPIRHLLFLACPWRASLPPQLTPSQLINSSDEVRERHEAIQQFHAVPLFAWRDTPIRSIYRMYEFITPGLNYMLQEEISHFYFHPDPARFRVEDIPDPHDPDPLRYAIVASIIETLAESFTWRQKGGLRRDGSILFDPDAPAICPPAWTKNVPAMPEPAIFHDGFINGDYAFTRRNIHMGNAYFYFV